MCMKKPSEVFEPQCPGKHDNNHFEMDGEGKWYCPICERENLLLDESI